MPRNWNLMFSGIFENIWHWEHSRGASTWPRGSMVRPPPGRAPCLMGPWWLPSTYSCTHTLLLPPKKITNQLKHDSCDFWSPCSKHLSQNCFGGLFLGMWLLHWSNSFCSSALFIANLCCLGDHALELACQIYMVPSSSNAWYSL